MSNKDFISNVQYEFSEKGVILRNRFNKKNNKLS